MSKKFKINLTKLNNERIVTARKRVAHAIRLINMPLQCQVEGHGDTKTLTQVFAHANNLLEAAVQDIKWACEYFKWNDDVCYQIEDAIGFIGSALSLLIIEKTDSDYQDAEMDHITIDSKQAFNILGMVLATLIRWFDTDQDVSEV